MDLSDGRAQPRGLGRLPRHLERGHRVPSTAVAEVLIAGYGIDGDNAARGWSPALNRSAQSAPPSSYRSTLAPAPSGVVVPSGIRSPRGRRVGTRVAPVKGPSWPAVEFALASSRSAAAIRVVQPSLERTFRTCMSRVLGLTNSSRAIWALVWPVATRRSTSCSRRVGPACSRDRAARRPRRRSTCSPIWALRLRSRGRMAELLLICHHAPSLRSSPAPGAADDVAVVCGGRSGRGATG